MPLDIIVVIVMALAFFGGFAYVIWKDQRNKKMGGQASSSAAHDRGEVDSSTKPHEKERKISKS